MKKQKKLTTEFYIPIADNRNSLNIDSHVPVMMEKPVPYGNAMHHYRRVNHSRNPINCAGRSIHNLHHNGMMWKEKLVAMNEKDHLWTTCSI